MTDMSATFDRIRGEILDAIVATEAEIATQRAAFAAAEADLAKAIADKEALFERIEKAVGQVFNPLIGKIANAPLSNSLRQSFVEFERSRREAAGRVARLRESLKNLAWHLDDRREALAQIEQVINPPAPAVASTNTVSDEAESAAANGWNVA